MDIDTEFGPRLKAALQRRNLRAADLARLTGTSNTRVSGWLHNKGLSVANLVQIGQTLHVSLNWLVHGIGNEQLASDGRLDALEENLVMTLRHCGPETVGHINRFLTCFRLSGLSTSLKHFRAHDLLNDQDLPHVVLDNSGKLLTANAPFSRLIGLSAEQAQQHTGQPYSEWLPRNAHAAARKLIQETLAEGHAVAPKFDLAMADGTGSSYMARSRMLDFRDVNGIQIVLFPWED